MASVPRVALTICALLPGSLTGADDASRRPDVILLLVDDMGDGDVAAHGSPMLKTPNFDKLHEQSARFTDFAVRPPCAPTRAALLAGRHGFLSGMVHTIDANDALAAELRG